MRPRRGRSHPKARIVVTGIARRFRKHDIGGPTDPGGARSVRFLPRSPFHDLSGRIERHEHFASHRVLPRRIDVRLPEGYDERHGERWPVLYMHDGQNLFDGSTSFSGVDWGVHRTLGRLAAEEGLRDAILVGIWNTPERIPEYMPERPMREIAAEEVKRRFEETYGGFPKSDAYLGMLVHELKPFIDGRYRTRGGREDTFIMGSSMGGLVSLYAICEYPDVFAGAGCLSTSWTIAGKLVLAYLQKRLPRSGLHRLYFDYGAEAQVARYESLQKTVDRMVVRSGYRRGVDWMTGRFPGAPHSESAWRDRVDVPLRFLLSQR